MPAALIEVSVEYFKANVAVLLLKLLNLTNNGLQILNPFIMLILYFIAFNLVFLVPLLIVHLQL